MDHQTGWIKFSRVRKRLIAQIVKNTYLASEIRCSNLLLPISIVSNKKIWFSLVQPLLQLDVGLDWLYNPTPYPTHKRRPKKDKL